MGGSPDRFRSSLEETKTSAQHKGLSLFTSKPCLELELHDGSSVMEKQDVERLTPTYASTIELNDEDVSKQQKRKSVVFGNINIRSYSVVMGDHPCCTMGCPLTLGWTYSEGARQSVDEYESCRSPRAERETLRTTWDERRAILSTISDRDVRRANRKLQRQQDCRSRSRVCAKFFNEKNLSNPLPSPTTTNV